MSRFDVFKNPDAAGWLLNVQSNLLDGLNTRVVVPLLPMDSAPLTARRLNPVFIINGEKAVMTTQFMAAVPERELQSYVTNLQNHQAEIQEALDLLLLGF